MPDESIQKTLYGADLFGAAVTATQYAPLAERFEFPPFSALDARSGDWRERKRAWIALGIQSEMGRDAKAFTTQHTLADGTMLSNQTGISIFDPVLCEIAYRWFCPPTGQVVDPFAGGSVRGLIAGLLGLRYVGIDLRHEQVLANEAQRLAIAPTADVIWHAGDAMELMPHAPEADFIFSCPPYGDLERYSDDPRDLSTMEYNTFLAAYKRIILRCAQRLKTDRFACFVVGDFRDARGYYRGFVADTIKAFQEVGLALYNDAVLLTSIGSLPIRVSAQFAASRKLGKTHQNVLVFAKGDPRMAFA